MVSNVLFICIKIKKQKQQLRDIKAGRLLPPGQNLELDEEEEEEEELEEVKEIEPTDRRPTLFDIEKGERLDSNCSQKQRRESQFEYFYNARPFVTAEPLCGLLEWTGAQAS